MKNVLCLNPGSATCKWQVRSDTGAVLAGATLPAGAPLPEFPVPFAAIGHRIVHGGSRFTQATRITPAVLTELAELNALAPLHNPPALARIAELMPLGLPQVAVFDTAFHTTLPEVAWRYPVPRDWPVRRYGFHGLSHQWVAERHAELVGTRERLVSLHLGNGSSACAIREGQSVDTSMGFTPLEGLMMGTRAGDVDPGLLAYVAQDLGWPETLHQLTHASGLRGVSGQSHDLRALSGPTGELAIAIYCYRALKYVGAYAAVLGGLDALVFTGGIGENSPAVRAAICTPLAFLGIHLQPAANEQGGEGPLGERVWLIPADEEALIDRETRKVLT